MAQHCFEYQASLQRFLIYHERVVAEHRLAAVHKYIADSPALTRVRYV